MLDLGGENVKHSCCPTKTFVVFSGRVVRINHLDFHDRSQTSFICLDACLGIMSQLCYFDMTTFITYRIQQSSRVRVVARFFMIGRNRIHIYFAP